MSRRALVPPLVLLCALAAPAAAFAGTPPPGRLLAGTAVVDTSYHVGSSAGQYASTRDGGYGEFDPHAQQVKNQASYGLQSRLSARALVLQEEGGEKVALLKTDLYIPQDMLRRRVAQLLAAKGIGIDTRNFTLTVSHDHSSPFYGSTGWGAWLFQDVIDLRFYEEMARRFARAVEQADARLVPVRVGFATGAIDRLHRHSFGPAKADDGSPAGYPNSDAEHRFTVVRIDDVSRGARRARPLAVLLAYSGHPEFLDGNDLISADYVGALERFVDRETGATTIFTQNAVGTAEPENSTYHSVHDRLEFSHRQYGQMETAARSLADAVVGTWRGVAAGSAAAGETVVPFVTRAPLRMDDRWFPGPVSHPYPGVSNCRTDQALHGNPGLPVVGLPDCDRTLDARPVFALTPFAAGLDTDDLERLGVPVPENYSAPGYAALEETLGIHLQALRLGDVLFTFCSCEQWKDQARNIQTRSDRVAGNEWLGYDWGAACAPADSLPCRKMRAQVFNDAAGWDDPAYAPYAESEPADPGRIKGNYTHDDTPEHAAHGYALTVPISMANDYNGYIATYREYQRGDHYRKALTGWGPHASDYLATRLVGMGRALNGDEAARAQLDAEPLNAKEVADQAHADVKATALGAAASAGLEAYGRALPDDGGEPAALDQPGDIERFAAASFRWRGGSNYVDDPKVVVERRAGGRWVPFGDGSGEVVLTLAYPAPEEGFSYLAGSHEWRWTATWEAFASRTPLTAPDGGRYDATPAGTYRFVVRGTRRTGGANVGYRVMSDDFRVRPWDGITVSDVRVDADGRPSFVVGPGGTREGAALRERDAAGNPLRLRGRVGPIDYPDSYAGPLVPRFVRPDRTVVRDPDAPDDAARYEWYCLECSFRPWVDAGDAETAWVTVVAADGARRRVRAEPRDGRWVAAVPLAGGERAFVAAGDVRDRYGDVNGRASESVQH